MQRLKANGLVAFSVGHRPTGKTPYAPTFPYSICVNPRNLRETAPQSTKDDWRFMTVWLNIPPR